MQIRTFDARTLDAAQAAVRAVLGDDALILATETTPAGIRITAAVETESRIGDLLAADDATEVDPHLERVLAFHGVPPALVRRLATAAVGIGEIEAALAASLRPHLKPATEPLRRVLVGPPGHGKTLAAARLAKASLGRGRKPRVLALRLPGAAACGRLRALLADTPLAVEDLDGIGALDTAIAAVDDGTEVVVDVDGLVAQVPGDAARLRAILHAVDAVGALVVSVEGQAASVLETVVDHLGLGCRSVLFTKLDATRRYGALVAVAAAGVRLEPVSVSGNVGDGLSRLSATGLARLLARRFDAAATPSAAR